MGTGKPKLYLSREDAAIRFVVIKKCISAGRAAGWTTPELESFVAVACELEPTLLSYVRERFEVTMV